MLYPKKDRLCGLFLLHEIFVCYHTSVLIIVAEFQFIIIQLTQENCWNTGQRCHKSRRKVCLLLSKTSTNKNSPEIEPRENFYFCSVMLCHDIIATDLPTDESLSRLIVYRVIIRLSTAEIFSSEFVS